MRLKTSLVMLFLGSWITLPAQEKPVRLSTGKPDKYLANLPVNYTYAKMTTAQKIEFRINNFLDSMIRTTETGAAFIQGLNAGTNNILMEFWKNGLLAGATRDQAFFVQCDSRTMTQQDIREGRLVLAVGYAPAKPAEFALMRFERILLNKSRLQHLLTH